MDWRRHVHVAVVLLADVVPLAHPEFRGQRLQVAALVARAIEAVIGVIGQQQFHNRSPRGQHLG